MNFDDVPHSNDYFVSADKRLIDPAFVMREIQSSYWGSWRSPMTILKSIDNSLCFGVFHHGTEAKDVQVGFARVVTDYCTFAWICDVVITKTHRYKGLGKFLMRTVLEHPEVKPRACMLATQDAQGLYLKFGFKNFVAMKKLPDVGAE